MRKNTTQREFSRDLESLEEIFNFIADFGADTELAQELVHDIGLVVEEIFVNMIEHNVDTEHDVAISICVDSNTLRVVLVDHDVERFDPTQRPEVDTMQPVHERQVGGLGIHLVSKLMDSVEYEFVNRTSTLTLIKKLES